MAATTTKLTFEKVTDTKNTRRFGEVVDEGKTALIGTVYLQNAEVARLGDPERITVTIAAA